MIVPAGSLLRMVIVLSRFVHHRSPVTSTFMLRPRCRVRTYDLSVRSRVFCPTELNEVSGVHDHILLEVSVCESHHT